VELVTKMLKSGGDNRFGQHVGKLIFIGNEENLKRVICYTIMNKMEINFHVLRSCMKTGFTERYVAPILSHHNFGGE
jgi:hypothetical protein